MAATSKPVRKMRKKGKEPTSDYHSPKASTKKAGSLEKHMTSAVYKHIEKRMDGKGDQGKEMKSTASRLYEKLPKSTKNGPIGRYIKYKSN